MSITQKQADKLISQNREVYNKIANHFSDTRTFLWDDLKPLAQYTKDGNKVLDIACGNGRLYHLFEKKQVEYTGVDYSSKLIDIAKRKYSEATFYVQNMEKLHFPQNSFDVIYCIAAFQHLPTREKRLETLSQIFAILKKGGTLVFVNWNLDSTWAQDKYKKFQFEPNDFMIPWRDGDGVLIGERYYHGFGIEELDSLLLESGFVDIEQWYVKKGQKITKSDGENIVTIARKD
jgi:tRNA (uracil-5-)-methyltransferase TRM9